jgi:GNAT superfamily N-acetyltransferase
MLLKKMIQLIRTNSNNQDFISLIALLDAYLRITDGEDHAFYAQYNKTDSIKQVVVVYDNKKIAACGAIKAMDKNRAEVKRMFTKENQRGKGIASRVLKELEVWAKELGYNKCVLETGKRQVEAVQLYLKNGYKIIPNYGPYIEAEDSICFEKSLT